MHIVNNEPVWIDGDAVTVRFVHKKKPNEIDGLLLSNPYTYIRRDGYWPGEAEWSSHDDDVMTAAWHEGRLGAMRMTDAPWINIPTDEYPNNYIIEARIAKRRLDNVRDILDTTSIDRPLSSFLDELLAVLG